MEKIVASGAQLVHPKMTRGHGLSSDQRTRTALAISLGEGGNKEIEE